MRLKLSRADIIWSYIGTIVSMGANVIILPIIMFFLSEDLIGLWYVFTSVGALVTLFDFGFSVTFARNITYCWSGVEKLRKEDVFFVNGSSRNYKLIKTVLSTCKVVYCFIATAALLLLISVGTFYIVYVTKNALSENIIYAWMIYSLAIAMNLYYGYYSSFLRGVGAVGQVNKNLIFARLMQLVSIIVLLAMKFGLSGVAISYLVYGLLFRVLGKKYFYSYENIGKHLEQITDRIEIQQIVSMLKIVWHNAWKDGLISLSNYMSNQVTVIICSLYLSLVSTGGYSIGVQIASAIAQISGTMYNASQPELQSAYVKHDAGATKRIMSKIVMSYIYLYIIGVVFSLFLLMPILRIIKPSLILPVPILLGLCIYQFMLKLRNCYTSYFSCTNRIIYLKGFIFGSLMCILFSLISLRYFKWGIWGLIISQIASQLIYNFWKWPIMAHKEMQLSIKEMIVLGTVGAMDSLKKKS